MTGHPTRLKPLNIGEFHLNLTTVETNTGSASDPRTRGMVDVVHSFNRTRDHARMSSGRTGGQGAITKRSQFQPATRDGKTAEPIESVESTVVQECMQDALRKCGPPVAGEDGDSDVRDRNGDVVATGRLAPIGGRDTRFGATADRLASWALRSFRRTRYW
jgi:hypothetical protein